MGASRYCRRETRDGVPAVTSTEVATGFTVPNNWDRALVEPWAERKARRAAERAQTAQKERQKA
jgi:hypothetical protein